MDWSLVVACLLALVRITVGSDCPHLDDSLVSWNDTTAWDKGQVPQDGKSGTLTGNVLLDTQPPSLLSLTIAKGAKLVFDPNTSVHLKIQAIYVDGELHIGSESCPFLSEAHITFYGNVDEDKVLLVRAGGTLEVHGSKKLPWTKLGNTAPKLENSPGFKAVVKDVANIKRCHRGLILYQINPSNGEVEAATKFDFDIGRLKFDKAVQDFVQALIDIPDGRIVGLAIRKTLFNPKRNYDYSPIFKAIELLVHDSKKTSPLRNVNPGSAYAMLTVKGDAKQTIEVFEADIKKFHTVTAQGTFGKFGILLDSHVHSGGGTCNNYVQLGVYLDENLRPTITLLDNVKSWNIGDKLVMASTDFNYNQAEEVTIIEKIDTHKVRLAKPLKFTHYGEMYKGVDMRGEVGLLTRNIKFDSEEAETSDTYGGHIKVLKDFARVHIEGAELENLGQQEVLGAYSVHFHMCEDVDGDEDTRPWIRQNSIHHSNSRCVTVHGTHGLIVAENVCYGTLGHSYFLEDGGEKRTVLDGNLGLGTHKPPKGKGLIHTDTDCPTTFWVTNPITYMRNNVAAGSHCRGYWYNFPDIPLGPSADKNFMLEFEARFTAIKEFENNVAHSSGGGSGLFIDNILLPNGVSQGYNKYRPVKDPVKNNCIKDDSNCENDCVYLNRFTGYKNAPSNVWVRGGCMKVTQSSMSDAQLGVQLLSDDDKSEQYVERSIIIGDSPNYGEPEPYLTEDSSIQRSFPFGLAPLKRALMRIGIEFLHKPMYAFDVWFGDFKNNEHYKMGALGWRQNNRGSGSPRSSVKGLKFGFTDPDEGNRVNDYHPDDVWYTNEDGDDVSNIRDIDGSVVDLDPATCDKTYTIVKAEPLHLTSECQVRDNWQMAWCCHNYGQLLILDNDGKDNPMRIVTLTRDDDYVNLRYDSDDNNNAPFLTILGGEYSYTAFFNKEMPAKIGLNANSFTNTEYLRLGLCIPPNAEFDLKTFQPRGFNGIKNWKRVDSLSALDSDTSGGKYFYHSDSGYFATLLRNANDFEEGEFSENPKNKKIFFEISITKGDRKKVNCLASAHKALGGLSPKKSTKRNLISMLRQLLHDNYHKRAESKTAKTDTRVLLMDSIDPPVEWGAGSNHVPRTIV